MYSSQLDSEECNSGKRLELSNYLNNDLSVNNGCLWSACKSNFKKINSSAAFINMANQPYYSKNSKNYNKRLRVFLKIKDIINFNLTLEGVFFFMHGSYAVGGVTNFSDIDLGVIVSEDISLEEVRILRGLVRKILNFIYSVDPLMHHGIDVFFTQDFINYDESILPVDTLKRSIALNNKCAFKIFTNDCVSVLSAKNKLVKQCESVLSYESTLINLSSYKLKCLISVVLLIPVLFIQAETGVFLCKRRSIERFREKYKNKFPLLAIDMATDLREAWNVPAYVGIIRNTASYIDFIFPVLRNIQRIAGGVSLKRGGEVKEFIKVSKLFALSIVKEIND
jgi:predicted nucleotidyltransferase